MAHQITKTDRVAIVGGRGWHGLGNEIPPGLTAFEALHIAGLAWEVEESESLLANFGGGESTQADDAKALRRSDTKEILGVVGTNYCPLPNSTLASLADGLGAGEGSPHITSAGSVQGGRKVWFCLKGDTTVMGGDEMHTQLVVANSHDGTGALRIHPSTIRIVCANTYAGSTADAHLGFSWRHTSGLLLKRDEIVSCLALWRNRLDLAKQGADHLASVDVNADLVREIFVAVYQRQCGYSIPLHPATPTENRRKERAIVALDSMSRVFDVERSAGCKPSAWLAANAATHWIQHTSGRLEDADRDYSNVLGLKAEQTAKAFATVTQLVS